MKKRISITNPLTKEKFSGEGELTTNSSQSSYGIPVWDIRLDNGDYLTMSKQEAELYKLEKV